jgi:hypothetical protein
MRWMDARNLISASLRCQCVLIGCNTHLALCTVDRLLPCGVQQVGLKLHTSYGLKPVFVHQSPIHLYSLVCNLTHGQLCFFGCLVTLVWWLWSEDMSYFDEQHTNISHDWLQGIMFSWLWRFRFSLLSYDILFFCQGLPSLLRNLLPTS